MMKYKKYISIIVITALLSTGLFSYPDAAYGGTTYTTYETVTYYRLDTGVCFLWKNSAGIWQNGWKPGENQNFTTNLKIPQDAKNVSAVAYDPDASYGETGYFPFESENGIDRDCIIWNTTDVAENKIDYYYNYYNDSAYPLSARGEYTSSSGKLEITYNATLSAYDGEDYDVKTKLMEGETGKQEIIALLGSPSAEITEAMDLMNPESENYSPTVEGYLYFLPLVIKYDVTEAVEYTINGFEPGLDVPSSAKAGEDFTVTDETVFEDNSEFAYSELYYSIDGGTQKKAADWDGDSLGGSIAQSFEDVGTVTYTLTVWNQWNTEKSVTETIEITDNREITVEPDLVLPEYSYVGHTELAEDASIFEVDGVEYSAARAYAEDIASNAFKCSSSRVDIARLTDTKAECTFEEKGTYSVDLKIKTAAGGSASDTESITVRKTPYIIESLSGFQKQNRKQILTAMVATTPGKPLTDYSVTLKDKTTGEIVTLTPDDPQENTSAIKTRAMKLEADENGEFTYITVEFLTKTPAYDPLDPGGTQDFYYQINVEDSKGDTDAASNTFAVSPDVPPAAAISMDTAFLRNEGTNIATIKAEDATIATDGDEVKRTWYYGATTAPSVFTAVSEMDSYELLSFGTDKTVGFDRTGVGKFSVKLAVRETWNEPTLEEYINESDYLTGTAIEYSEVQNVAPVVSLALLEGTEQEILLLANSDSEYQTLLSGKTALQQELLANRIDGRIIIKKLLGDSPGSVSGITNVLNYSFPCPVWSSGTEEEADYSVMTADSEKSYLATWTCSGNSLTAPVTVHAYDPFRGEIWSYSTTRNERFSFGNDDANQYLYLIYKDSNQTVILDKNTGALAGTVNVALSEKVWLTDDLIFWRDDSSALNALQQNTSKRITVDTGVCAVGRVAGDLQYITKTSDAILRNTLDLETLEKNQTAIVTIAAGTASTEDYVPVCIDGKGKVVLYKKPGSGTDGFCGAMAYDECNELISEVSTGFSSANGYTPAYNEAGECNYLLAWSRSSYTYNVYAINLAAARYAHASVTAESSIGPTAAFQSGENGYFYIPGWYVKAGSGYFGAGRTILYNGGTSISTSTTGCGRIGAYDENTIASDRIVTTLMGNGSTGTMQVKISSFPKTLLEETKEIIARFAGKFTFVGDVDTTAEEIIAAAEAAKPVTKITAAQNGSMSLYNQALEENKKYYYEYEMKPLSDGTESSLNGMTASTAASTSGQTFASDTYYVSNTYIEDFQDSDFNDFFTLTDGGTFRDGYYGVDSDYDEDENTNNHTALTFIVPAGKKAILSFDWLIRYDTATLYKNSIYIDGTRMYEDLPAEDMDNYGHCVYQSILGEGTHTIECRVCYVTGGFKVMMDNLTVETLSANAPRLASSFNANEGEGDWLSVNGVFETPNGNIAYGSQTSTYWSGSLSGTATSWYRKSKYGTAYPRELYYTQTISPGYYGRGYLYPYVGSSSEESKLSVWNHTYTMYEESSSSLSQAASIGNGDQVMLGMLQQGTTYSYDLEGPSGLYASPYIYPFELITYPVNTATSTGDIAFDSTNTKYFFPKTTSTGLTNLSIELPKGEFLIKNLKIYYIDEGNKIYLQNDDCQELTDLSKWTLSAGLTKSLDTETEKEEEEDDYVRIYKKGEKVLYDIYYSDYEDDPSKIGYWRYEHINWPPDPVHPDAGKILTAPIDRFYLSGKYTVTHWEVDNTQRTGTVGESSSYNKESNQVTMTFYVDGEGEAPWITYIKTNPAAVTENDSYTIRVGVDDEEKDDLSLTTEVYLNGSEIVSDTKTVIHADGDGAYPEQTIAGLPKAEAGSYQVFCTVSDYSGTGIKSYRYLVVSEGSVAGLVSHTDQWDQNRKKYNLKRFGEEVNRTLLFDDYIALPTPRKRGSNVFWSGEQFRLRAETEGDPVKVAVRILSTDASGNLSATGYSTDLSDTGKKTENRADIWEGSLWEASMINQWGRNAPVELTFRFTAEYAGGTIREDTETVIMDSGHDYWQLHRLW